MAQTMLGMPSPVGDGSTPEPRPEAQSQPRPKPNPQLAGTMIGMPAPNIPGSPGQGGAPSPAQPAAAPSGGAGAGFAKTMVGVGMPSPVAGLAAPGQSAHGQDPAPGHPVSPPSAASAPPSREGSAPKFGATILGVAQPGIAPSHSAPGQAPPPAPPSVSATPQASPSAATPVASQPTAPVPTGLRTKQPGQGPFPTSRPTWVNVALVAAAMAAAAAIGGAFALMSPKPVKVSIAEFSIDENGNDQLRVSCSECPGGSTLYLGRSSATVRAGEATLHPETPLKIGRNELEFSLKGLDGELSPTKPVILPIAFRVLTNWSGRHASPPYGEISVSAPEGSSVEIDGKSVALKGQKATHRVLFKDQSTGEKRDSEAVSFDLPVKVTVDGKDRHTRASLKSAIAPLTLISPAPVHQLSGKPLSIQGQSAVGAKISAGDAKTVADKKGYFSLIIESPKEGPLVISANTSKSLTRRQTIQLVKKSATPKGVKTSFSAIKAGDEVIVFANVIESRIHQGATRALLEVQKGCKAPPCLMRADYGEPYRLQANRVVKVSGSVVAGDPMTIRVRRFR